MEAQPEVTSGEIKHLRRCINDLVSLLALPAIWSGGDPSQVLHTLLDALLRMLRLDLVAVRLTDPVGEVPVETVRIAEPRGPMPSAHEIFEALSACLKNDSTKWPALLRDLIGEGDVSIVPVPLGLQGELGVIVAAAERSDFPRQTEALLLSVAANQASIGLQEARLRRQQRLLAADLDQKVAQRTAELAAAEERWRSVFENSAIGVALAALDGRFLATNPVFESMSGYTEEELQRLTFLDITHEDDVEPNQVLIGMLLSGNLQQFQIEKRYRRKNGSPMWVRNNVSLVPGTERVPPFLMALSEDITERKLAEEDRRRAEEALRSSETRLSRATQIATVGEFAASIAHEINQPLAAVVTNGHACLRWLSAQPPSLPKAQEAAERIIRDGKEAGEVVRRIRALFKHAALDKSDLDLNEVIAEVLHLLNGERTRRSVSVETDLDKEIGPVAGDRVQLQQVVFNLLLNAIEAMDPVVDRPKNLFIRSKRHSPEAVLVEIRDSGVGLKDPEKIFEAFFTTKENGMGMGLAVCRSIIDAHHGRLWAGSGDGAGTTFSFTLPAAS